MMLTTERNHLNQNPADLTGINWHTLSPAECLAALETVSTTGLSTQEALARQARFGLNELTEGERTTIWQMLWQQFNNFVVILLIVAAVVSALLGDYPEAAAIMAIVILNAVLGVVQEYNAEKSLAALKKLAAPEAHVVRDGSRDSIPARELVPGDIILLEAGNYVPADVRLVEIMNLRIEEAALTGKSVPVEKRTDVQLPVEASLGDRKNMAFMGTIAAYGRGRGVVVSTGMQTQIGRIAELLASVDEEQTPSKNAWTNLVAPLELVRWLFVGLYFWLAGGRATMPWTCLSSRSAWRLLQSLKGCLQLSRSAWRWGCAK